MKALAFHAISLNLPTGRSIHGASLMLKSRKGNANPARSSARWKGFEGVGDCREVELVLLGVVQVPLNKRWGDVVHRSDESDWDSEV